MVHTHKQLAVFVSGRGSNMQALWYASQNAESRYRVACVVADQHCPALDFAHRQAIPHHLIDADDRLIAKSGGLRKLEDSVLAPIDIIALAGFMRLVGADFLRDWKQQGKQIVNIHPSLLPKYPGLDAHARAIAARDTHAGCTVHHVDAGIDSGEIIAQSSCPIRADDTPQSLAARVIVLEHELYHKCLNRLC